MATIWFRIEGVERFERERVDVPTLFAVECANRLLGLVQPCLSQKTLVPIRSNVLVVTNEPNLVERVATSLVLTRPDRFRELPLIVPFAFQDADLSAYLESLRRYKQTFEQSSANVIFFPYAIASKLDVYKRLARRILPKNSNFVIVSPFELDQDIDSRYFVEFYTYPKGAAGLRIRTESEILGACIFERLDDLKIACTATPPYLDFESMYVWYNAAVHGSTTLRDFTRILKETNPSLESRMAIEGLNAVDDILRSKVRAGALKELSEAPPTFQAPPSTLDLVRWSVRPDAFEDSKSLDFR